MLRSAARYPDKIALEIEGVSYTYAQLRDASCTMAQVLLKQGLNRGDRVAVYMDNTWPCIVSIYGTLLAGGVFLMINPQTKADKLNYILADSEAVVLLTDTHFPGSLSRLCRGYHLLRPSLLPAARLRACQRPGRRKFH